MSDQANPSSAPPRRMSISAIFAPLSNSISANTSSSPPTGVPTTPSTVSRRRGGSISTLGLAGSANDNASPFSAFAKQRRASVSTTSAASSPEFRNSFSDDNAVIEADEQAVGSPPSPSFARRVSFGAQALRDVRQSSGTAHGGRRPSSSLYTLSEDHDRATTKSTRPVETVKAAGEGFNWSDALRDRTKRSPSFSSGNPFLKDTNRPKAAAPAAPEPPKEMPKPMPGPQRSKKPDHMGERMLRGDFMMD